MAMDPAANLARCSTPRLFELFAPLEELASVSSVRALRASVSLTGLVKISTALRMDPRSLLRAGALGRSRRSLPPADSDEESEEGSAASPPAS